MPLYRVELMNPKTPSRRSVKFVRGDSRDAAWNTAITNKNGKWKMGKYRITSVAQSTGPDYGVSDNPHRRRRSNSSDLGQSAFEAGKRWVGQAHESGVANARVVRYGFLKWWNNQSPQATKGSRKAQLEKDFRQGYAAGKRTGNPASRLNPHRLTPVAFHIKGRRHTGKAKLVGGKVKIYVTPGVAKSINPKAGVYRVVSGGAQKVRLGPFKTKAVAQRVAKEQKRDGVKSTKVVKSLY